MQRTQGVTVASMAQLVERSAVNRQVLGSIPSGGALFFTVLQCGHRFTLCYTLRVQVFLVGVVGNISACHADARGSIPRLGAFFV